MDTPRLSFWLRFAAGMVIILHEAFLVDVVRWEIVTASLAMMFGTSAVEAVIRRLSGGGNGRE